MQRIEDRPRTEISIAGQYDHVEARQPSGRMSEWALRKAQGSADGPAAPARHCGPSELFADQHDLGDTRPAAGGGHKRVETADLSSVAARGPAEPCDFRARTGHGF